MSAYASQPTWCQILHLQSRPETDKRVCYVSSLVLPFVEAPVLSDCPRQSRVSVPRIVPADRLYRDRSDIALLSYYGKERAVYPRYAPDARGLPHLGAERFHG